MAWAISFSSRARQDLAALDKTVASRITAFLRGRVSSLENPRIIGEALKGSKLGAFWKYRVGDYRIIASIEDYNLHILIVRIGNRRDVYRK